jgi:GNAT superfamily N-acetyltransferase
VTLEIVHQLTPELTDHLENVDWGFETGVRYRILERLAMLNTVIPHGEFRLLRDHEHLIGTLFSLHKNVSFGGKSLIKARYETLLSVRPEEHGKGHAKALIRAALSREETPAIQYAYIEAKNSPSAAAFKAQGYEIFGRFLATTFNRLRPTLSPHVELISTEHVDVLKNRLAELYQDHLLNDFDISFDPAHYWVFLDQGKPVAGVQIEEELWSITSMPGPDGWFAVHILPHLPFLNKILNPRKIPVLKLGHLYAPEGCEKEFMELAMHLTRYYRKKLALAYLDPRSSVYKRLKEKIPFGLFNPLFETPVNIWARFQGFTANEIATL